MTCEQGKPRLTQELEKARNFFAPEKLGFQAVTDTNGHHLYWTKELMVQGTPQVVRFYQLGPQHIHRRPGQPYSAFEIVSEMHKKTFKIERESDVIAPHQMVNRTVIVASLGPFTMDTALGFSIADRGNDGVLPSKATAVMPDSRNAKIAFNLKLLQACKAASDGLSEITWVEDGSKGPTSGLFFGMGAEVDRFIINHYGENIYNSSNTKTDRLSLSWRLGADNVHEAITRIRTKKSHQEKKEIPSQSFKDIMHLPVIHGILSEEQQGEVSFNGFLLTDIDGNNLDPHSVRIDNLDTLLFEIPADIEKLEPAEKEKVRAELRHVFSSFVDTDRYIDADPTSEDAAAVQVIPTEGRYRVPKFHSVIGPDGQRRNFYELVRKVPATL